MTNSRDLEVSDERARKSAVLKAASTVVRAGIWLIKNGYGNMMLLPYESPSGGAWRCEFHQAGKKSRTLYRYSSSSGNKYFADHCGGTVHANVSAPRLAQAIIQCVPDEVAEECQGDASPETLGWLMLVEAGLREGSVPLAFHAYSTDTSRWESVSLVNEERNSFPAPPGYVAPGAERSIVELEWHAGEAAWNAMAGEKSISLSLDMFRDDEQCFDFADRLRRAFLQTKDGFDASRLLRAMVGSLGNSGRA